MLEIFDIVQGQLIFRMPMVMAIKEFKYLYHRRKYMEGDSQGVKKKLNTLEFVYVIAMGDDLLSNNIYAGFHPKERQERIKEDIGMPALWKPDEHVKAAIEKYVTIQRTYVPSASALAGVERGIKLAGAAIDSYVEQLYDVLQDANKIIQTTEEGMTEEQKALLAVKNDAIFSSLKRIIDLSTTLPKSIKSINELRAEVSKEERNAPKKANGREIGRYESPEKNVV